jgi:hypothetical protein
MYINCNENLVTLTVQKTQYISDAQISVTVVQICNSDMLKGSSGKSVSTLTFIYTTEVVHVVWLYEKRQIYIQSRRFGLSLMSIYRTDSSWLLDMKVNLFHTLEFHLCLFISRSRKVGLHALSQALKNTVVTVLRTCFNTGTMRSAHTKSPVWFSEQTPIIYFRIRESPVGLCNGYCVFNFRYDPNF